MVLLGFLSLICFRAWLVRRLSWRSCFLTSLETVVTLLFVSKMSCSCNYNEVRCTEILGLLRLVICVAFVTRVPASDFLTVDLSNLDSHSSADSLRSGLSVSSTASGTKTSFYSSTTRLMSSKISVILFICASIKLVSCTTACLIMACRFQNSFGSPNYCEYELLGKEGLASKPHNSISCAESTEPCLEIGEGATVFC